LFLGDAGGLARIYDPPTPPVLLDYRVLVSRWKGSGVAVSPTSDAIDDMVGKARMKMGLIFGVVTAFVGLCYFTLRNAGSNSPGLSQIVFLKRSVLELVVLASMALAAGFALNLIGPHGLLAWSRGVEAIRLGHFEQFLPKLSCEQVAELLNDPSVTIIDARYRRDFLNAHIEGAVSIPVDATPELCASVMSTFPKSQRLLVYCQSESCRFAKRVAAHLSVAGFRNISLFPGGWREWVAWREESAHSASDTEHDRRRPKVEE